MNVVRSSSVRTVSGGIRNAHILATLLVTIILAIHRYQIWLYPKTYVAEFNIRWIAIILLTCAMNMV